MSPRLDADLLRPTLTDSDRLRPIYSARTGFLTSFFGGPMAGAIVTGVNAYRLGRLSKDGWLVALGVSAAVAVLWWLIRLDGQDWLRTTIGRNGPRLVNNVAGSAFFSISYLVHRPFYRTMEFAGITPPNGWVVGLASVLIAAVVTVALAILFLR